MYRKVDKIFIGGNVASTVTAGQDITAAQAAMLEGEIVVLDADYLVADSSVTFADTQTIYIAEGSSEIFNTVNPDGSALSGRRLLISNPIHGDKVVNFNSKPYSAKVEFAAALPAITDTIVPGTEYILRIVYKGDIATMHPGQNLETYRYIAKSGDDASAVYNGLVARINKYNFNNIKRTNKALVTAVNNEGVLELTAKPVISCTTSVNDIDELVMNSFEVRLNYVDNDYNWTGVTLASDITYTAADRGNGTWETVRDLEKHAQSYEGVSNRTWFPVIKPQMRTVKDTEYSMYTIEHDVVYRSPEEQYNKETSLTTIVAIDSNAVQQAQVFGTLDTWLQSLPQFGVSMGG